MKTDEFHKLLREIPLDELAKKIDKCDSITLSYHMLRKYISRKIEFAETQVANDTNEDIDFEDLSISLMEDLNRCLEKIVHLGVLSITQRLSLRKCLSNKETL